MLVPTKTKPISSPGRTEKFQPPLMLRFLRSNVGSKSGRSRSTRASPMFIRNKKNAVLEANQEPSSPKVSCIGQVRVRRSSASSKKSNKSRSPRHRRRRHCWWVRRPLFCCHWKLLCFSRPRSLRRGSRGFWRKWVLFFRFGYCKRVDVRENSLEPSPNLKDQYRNAAADIVEYEQERQKINEIEQVREEFVSISPPKNAFLLTRCRSAPYRSSSLANRFWESPSKTGEDENEEEEKTEEVEDEERDEEQEEEEEETGEGEPSCCSSSCSRRIEEEGSRGSIGILQGRNSEGSCRIRVGVEEDGDGGGKPLILTRCKSEPAKTGERLIIATAISLNKVGLC